MSEIGKRSLTGGSTAPQAVQPAALVDYSAQAVVSRVIYKGAGGSMTVFAFDEGQGLDEHSAPFDAWVQVLEGTATPVIGGTPVALEAGGMVLMPAGIPHALKPGGRFKMLLTMIRHG